MNGLEKFIISIEHEEFGPRRSALIQNMYYHIFSSKLVNEIGHVNIAKQIKNFETQGENLDFWKAKLTNIDFIPPRIQAVQFQVKEICKQIDAEQDPVEKLRKRYKMMCIVCSYPQLFMIDLSRQRFMQQMFLHSFNIEKYVGNSVQDLLDILNGTPKEDETESLPDLIPEPSVYLDDQWNRYMSDQTVEWFCNTFKEFGILVDKLILKFIKDEVAHFLLPPDSNDAEVLNPWNKQMDRYEDDLVDIHKKACKLMYGEQYESNCLKRWEGYRSIFSGDPYGETFDSFFKNLDNMYFIDQSNEDTRRLLDELECNYHESDITDLFETYTCYSHSRQTPVQNITCYELTDTESYSSYESESDYESYSYDTDSDTSSYETVVPLFDFNKLVRTLSDLDAALWTINVNTIDDDGETLLMKAVRWRQDEAVLYLCNRGDVDMNVQNRTGKTALHMTCGKLHKDKWSYVPLLVEKGANPFIKSFAGKDAMYYAIQRHAYSTVKALKMISGYKWFHHRRLLEHLPIEMQNVLYL